MRPLRCDVSDASWLSGRAPSSRFGGRDTGMPWISLEAVAHTGLRFLCAVILHRCRLRTGASRLCGRAPVREFTSNCFGGDEQAAADLQLATLRPGRDRVLPLQPWSFEVAGEMNPGVLQVVRLTAYAFRRLTPAVLKPSSSAATRSAKTSTHSTEAAGPLSSSRSQRRRCRFRRSDADQAEGR